MPGEMHFFPDVEGLLLISILLIMILGISFLCICFDGELVEAIASLLNGHIVGLCR
jgi:hypothetical protein